MSRTNRQAEAGPASGAAQGPRPDLGGWDNPLGYLAQAQARARMISTMIDTLASAALPDIEAMAEVLDYLETGLPQHVQAERTCFFPLLSARCTEEDNIGPVIDNVTQEQALTLARLPQAAALLRDHLADGRPFAPQGQAVLHQVAGHARRQVVVAHAILLPIARARLTKADLAALRARMLAASAEPDAGDRLAQ